MRFIKFKECGFSVDDLIAYTAVKNEVVFYLKGAVKVSVTSEYKPDWDKVLEFIDRWVSDIDPTSCAYVVKVGNSPVQEC